MEAEASASTTVRLDGKSALAQGVHVTEHAPHTHAELSREGSNCDPWPVAQYAGQEIETVYATMRNWLRHAREVIPGRRGEGYRQICQKMA